MLAARDGKTGQRSIGKGTQRDTFQLGQGDVGEAGRHSAGVVELRRGLADRHAETAVDQHIDLQIAFFVKPFQQQFTVARIGIPIQVAKIVTRHVFLMIRKLNPTAQLTRTALRQHLTVVDAPRDQRQVFQLLQKLGVEDRHEAQLSA